LPGELWTKQRDQLRQATRWEWRGGEVTTDFPWGREKYHDQLTFQVQDLNSDVSSAHGEAETSVELPSRTLIWRAQLDLRGDKTHFFYKFKRQLLQNGQLIREKTWEEAFPRDHQ
jgi:hypothetical protein